MANLELKEGWATVALLLITLLFVAWSIQAAQWTEGLSSLQAVVLGGGILGIILAKSRTPSRLAHLLSLLAGFTWSAYLTSRVLASATGLPLEMAAVELSLRLQAWLLVVFAGGNASGATIFLLLLSLLMWLLSYFCAWAIFRWQRVWWAVIVSGVALMINLSHAPNNLTGFLIAFTLFALLLVVRTSLAFYEQEWRAARVGYSPELVYDFLRAGLAVAILAIALAWFTPDALASRPAQRIWNKVSEPWRRLQDHSSRMFQNLNYQNEPALVIFTRSMKFGGAVELSDEPVIDVQAPAGRYWRVIVFHEYTSDGWINTDADTILIDESQEDILIPEFDLRQEITQTITLQQDLGPLRTIVAAGQPLRANIPLRAVVGLVTEDAPPGDSGEAAILTASPGDPSVLYAQPELKAGDSYQVVSSLTAADAESLRQAGTDYPAWVTPRYLQLPESLPRRVVRLAEQLTADHETAYDKATAIERYLRDIPYNEKIDAPAPGQDGVDYFLFDVQEGYCDYYSSAMVVMLRSVGVPARFVRGYSRGREEKGVYHVQEKDGHAWPEVFFPGYGWVEFEPTAGQPVLVRPESQDAAAAGGLNERDRDRAGRPYDPRWGDVGDPGDLGRIPAAATPSFWQRAGRWGGLALCAIVFVLAATALVLVRRRRQIEGLSVAERVYQDLIEWVRRLLQISPQAHQTPHEYAGSVGSLVPYSRQAIEQIADLYVEERFGGRAVPGNRAEEAWRQVWPALWRRWLHHRREALHNLRPKFRPSPPPPPLWDRKENTPD